MIRSFALAALALGLIGLAAPRAARAEEPKATGTVDISSSVADVGKLNAFQGTGVLLDQKEWEKLAAAWGIKDVPKVDFSKELLLVGTYRGSNFKFVGNVKNGDLTVEIIGDKETAPGFRYKVLSLDRKGITKFQGKELPPPPTASAQPIKERDIGELTGTVSDRGLLKSSPASRVIATQKEWDMVVKDWNIKNPPPVDFSRDIVVVGTTNSDSITIAPTVKDGNLTVATTEGKDTRDGFRYRFVTVRREGIKTVNGKPLPPAERPATPPANPAAAGTGPGRRGEQPQPETPAPGDRDHFAEGVGQAGGGLEHQGRPACGLHP